MFLCEDRSPAAVQGDLSDYTLCLISKHIFLKMDFFYSFMFVKDIKPILATILKALPMLIGLSDSRGLALEQFIFASFHADLV